jgi:TolB protein
MNEKDRFPLCHGDEQTVSLLLCHMQQMRRTVPVNYHLKSELKKQLLQRMKELGTQTHLQEAATPPSKGKMLFRFALVTAALAAAFGGYAFWQKDALSQSQSSLLSLSPKTSVEQVDIDATGSQVAYIIPQAEIRTLALDKQLNPGTVKLPSSTGVYPALSWANHGKQIAVVEQQGDQSRIWIVDLPKQNKTGASRLLKEEDGVRYDSPSWSPNDETIAYTRRRGSAAEIWVTSTVSFQEWKLAEGSQPEWSPDGRFLAFRKEERVQVMEMRTGKITVLGKGAWPSWSDATQLTYTTTEGNLTEAMLDVQPPVTRDLPLRKTPDKKLIRVSWSQDGTQLLLFHHDEQPGALVISLASR